MLSLMPNWGVTLEVELLGLVLRGAGVLVCDDFQ